MREAANKRAGGDGGIPRLLHTKRAWPAAPHHERWTRRGAVKISHTITLLLLILCTSVFGGDDITVATTVKPSSIRPGQTTTKDVFKRAGETNLVRVTTSRDGAVISRVHRFYHKGRLVANYMQKSLRPEDGSDLTTTAGFSLTLSFGTNNQILEAYVGDKHGNIIDAFTCTNSLLFPVSSTDLKSLKKSLATLGEAR